jgi:hypothetical protein
MEKVLLPTQVVTMAELTCSHLHHHIYSTQSTSQVSTISQAIKPALSNPLIAFIFLYFSCCNCSYPTSLLTLFGVDDHEVLWIICGSEVLHICFISLDPPCSIICRALQSFSVLMTQILRDKDTIQIICDAV